MNRRNGYDFEDWPPEDTPSLENPHYELLKSENYVSENERRWYAWVKECETVLGHNLDGDQETDGYSLDAAMAAFDAGKKATAYIAEVLVETNARRIIAEYKAKGLNVCERCGIIKTSGHMCEDCGENV